MPLLERLCLRHRIIQLMAAEEDQDLAGGGINAPGTARYEARLKAVPCRSCRSRNGMPEL